MAGKDDNEFDADKLAYELKDLIETTDLTMSSKRCIFRVLNILYRHNPQAYDPNAFSIGPFHHNKPQLKATQKIKLKYLQSLVSRSPDLTLQRLTRGIGKDLQSFHDCYEGPIGMSMKEFLKVLAIDGCFLVELLRRNRYHDLGEKDDPIFTTSCMYEFLHHDVILIENQIPWRVLDRLYDMTADLTRHKLPLVELAVALFHESSATGSTIQTALETRIDDLRQSKHVLDFLRNAMVLPFPNRTDRINCGFSWQAIPTAITLEEAGIRFKKSESSESIFTINFTNDGVFEIPKLCVNEITEPLFRNLISYEQCLPNCKGVVTSYAVLMDKLINSAADMEVLCRNEVVKNWLSTEDATSLFNRLYNDTCVRDYHYTLIEASINKYCGRRWPRYRRALMHDYLKHPWAIISLAAAVALLVLTFLQTLFTINKKIMLCSQKYFLS